MKASIFALAATSTILLAGCAIPVQTEEQDKGVMATEIADVAPIAKSAVKLMEHQYAPASTQLVMVEPQDSFGKTFEAELRTAGYSVLEKPYVLPMTKEGKPIPFEVPAGAKQLSYVLDTASADGRLKRLLVKVDNAQYSAVFSNGIKGVQAASPWSLKKE